MITKKADSLMIIAGAALVSVVISLLHLHRWQ
jgi:hypothetical protein